MIPLENLAKLKADLSSREAEIDSALFEGLLEVLNENIRRRKQAMNSIKGTGLELAAYRHSARGTTYEVEEIGLNSTNGPHDGRPVVLYRGSDGIVWVRDLEQFKEETGTPKVKRFVLVGVTKS